MVEWLYKLYTLLDIHSHGGDTGRLSKYTRIANYGMKLFQFIKVLSRIWFLTIEINFTYTRIREYVSKPMESIRERKKFGFCFIKIWICLKPSPVVTSAVLAAIVRILVCVFIECILVCMCDGRHTSSHTHFSHNAPRGGETSHTIPPPCLQGQYLKMIQRG